LWVDCGAATLAGVLVLAFSTWLARLHGLPHEVVLFLGTVNLLFAAYSFSLARRTDRSLLQIVVLVNGNAAWAIVCLGLAAHHWEQLSAFGIAHLVGEACFVGGLARLEWNQRHRLAGRRLRDAG